jgi:hypothetical protein
MARTLPGDTMTDKQKDDEDPVAIAIAFIIIVVATTALHVSGTIHVPGF